MKRKNKKTESKMKTILCKKFNEELEALEKPPTFGEVGKLAYENLSKDAWKLWMTIQAIMINERQSDLAASDDTVLLLKNQFKPAGPQHGGFRKPWGTWKL